MRRIAADSDLYDVTLRSGTVVVVRSEALALAAKMLVFGLGIDEPGDYRYVPKRHRDGSGSMVVRRKRRTK